MVSGLPSEKEAFIKGGCGKESLPTRRNKGVHDNSESKETLSETLNPWALRILSSVHMALKCPLGAAVNFVR